MNFEYNLIFHILNFKLIIFGLPNSYPEFYIFMPLSKQFNKLNIDNYILKEIQELNVITDLNLCDTL